ncbi:L-rhamnose-binding lectin ELEL-1 isoform X2 [Aethina tumida]|uniref:L-rhamnose-binding lectin ELEL-1 isoform X2 n=1 Tax=Aethina tumida TaxID=116153 RepID=UPI0021473FF4|nr:L-rhamnose-binding lectin ELEL-1 isoform X2 [Aethina tumida]
MLYQIIVVFMLIHILAADDGKHSFIAQEMKICENQKNAILCPTNMIIKIVSAVYGKSGPDEICGSKANVQCFAAEALPIVFEICDGKNRCELEASNKIFGDPCEGIPKHLRVSYTCQFLFCSFMVRPEI